MKRLETISNHRTGREARVFLDFQGKEYRVQFFIHGNYQGGRDYLTGDRGDAQCKARSFAWRNRLSNVDTWIDQALMATYEDRYC